MTEQDTEITNQEAHAAQPAAPALEMTWESPGAPAEVWPGAFQQLNHGLATIGYTALSETGGGAVFQRRHSPPLFWVGYILLFPLGLLLLLARPTEILRVTIAENGTGGTRFEARGDSRHAALCLESIANPSPSAPPPPPPPAPSPGIPAQPSS